jgi:lipooligosaccharide transport system permease protein
MSRVAAMRAWVAGQGGWRVILAMRPWSAVRVLEYHLLGYRRAWRGTLFSSFLSPVLFLAAIGIGLGTLVDQGEAGGVAGVAYIAFLAPGLLAANAMQAATFESTYPVMAGLTWLRTFVAMVTTPLRPFDVVVGTLLFVAFRLLLVGVVFTLIAVAFGAVDLLRGLAMVPAAVLTGLAFAAPIMAFSATQRGDAGFSALFRFVITPLFLFSGTFFPITQLPPLIQPIAYLTPLWHGVSLTRGIALGTIDAPLALLNLSVLLGFLVVGSLLAAVTFSRKLIK